MNYIVLTHFQIHNRERERKERDRRESKRKERREKRERKRDFHSLMKPVLCLFMKTSKT